MYQTCKVIAFDADDTLFAVSGVESIPPETVTFVTTTHSFSATGPVSLSATANPQTVIALLKEQLGAP